jgi:hypothetical protein
VQTVQRDRSVETEMLLMRSAMKLSDN